MGIVFVTDFTLLRVLKVVLLQLNGFWIIAFAETKMQRK